MQQEYNQKRRMSLSTLLLSEGLSSLSSSSKKASFITPGGNHSDTLNTIEDQKQPCRSSIKNLKDQRIRNKTASAKYRAKKSTQYLEMQKTIKLLIQQNTMLQNQLQKYEGRNHDSNLTSSPSSSITTHRYKSATIDLVLPFSNHSKNNDEYSAYSATSDHHPSYNWLICFISVVNPALMIF